METGMLMAQELVFAIFGLLLFLIGIALVIAVGRVQMYTRQTSEKLDRLAKLLSPYEGDS